MSVEHKCRNCIHWRDKAWAGIEGIGICDNAKVRDQIKTVSTNQIRALTGASEFDAEFIYNSIHFHSDFGCIHFDAGSDKEDDSTKAAKDRNDQNMKFVERLSGGM